MSNRFGAFCKTRLDGFIETKLEARACPSGFVYFISSTATEVWLWKLRASNGSVIYRVDLASSLSFLPTFPNGNRLQRLVLDEDGAFLYFNAARLFKVDTANNVADIDRVIWESPFAGNGGLDIAPDGDLRWGSSRVSAASGATIWGGTGNAIVSAGMDNSIRSAFTSAFAGFQVVQKHDENGALQWNHILPGGPQFNVGNTEGIAVMDNGNTLVSYETRVPVGFGNFNTRYFMRTIDPDGVFIQEASPDLDITGFAFGLYPTESRTGVTWFYQPQPDTFMRRFNNQGSEIQVTTLVPFRQNPRAAHRGISEHFVGRPDGTSGNGEDVARLSIDYQTVQWSIPISLSIDGLVRSIGSHDA